MERVTPRGRRLEQVGGDVFDASVGKALARSANRSFRDVERRGTKTPRGKLLSIVAQAAAHRERRISRGWQGMPLPELKQTRSGAEISPTHRTLPPPALLVEHLEPPTRVSL